MLQAPHRGKHGYEKTCHAAFDTANPTAFPRDRATVPHASKHLRSHSSLSSSIPSSNMALLLLCSVLFTSVAAQVFNTTFEFVLDALSPIIEFDADEWTYDPGSKSRRSIVDPSARDDTARMQFKFVAQSYHLHAGIMRPSNSSEETDSEVTLYGLGHPQRRVYRQVGDFFEDGHSPEPRILDGWMDVWNINTSIGVFYSMTLDVPVRTQA